MVAEYGDDLPIVVAAPARPRAVQRPTASATSSATSTRSTARGVASATRTVHYGLVPRSNRACSLNELPDLAARVQVAHSTWRAGRADPRLQLRLPLDMLVVASAGGLQPGRIIHRSGPVRRGDPHPLPGGLDDEIALIELEPVSPECVSPHLVEASPGSPGWCASPSDERSGVGPFAIAQWRQWLPPRSAMP